MVQQPVSNTSLKFESLGQLNTGIDLAFKGNRINLGFDYFSTLTKDMLVRKSIPFYLGEYFSLVNSGRVRNRGIDLSLTAHLIYRERFRWSIGVNLTRMENRVMEIADGEVITPLKEAPTYHARENHFSHSMDMYLKGLFRMQKKPGI